MPEGIYAEKRDLVYGRDRIMKNNISANRIQRWLVIYFQKYLGLYTRFDAIRGLAVFEKAPLLKDVIALGVNEIRKIWHEKKKWSRGVTEDRAKPLVEATHNRVGLDGETGAYVERLLAIIKGVGSITIAGFIAEVGDIRRFDSPKKIQKYAGLELGENSSNL